MDNHGLAVTIAQGDKSQSRFRADNKPNPPALVIKLAGRVTVECASAVFTERLLYGSQARLVFAMLVLERNRPLSRDELADALWPGGLPRTWGPALRGVVSKVRAFMATAGIPENAPAYDGFGAYQLNLSTDVVVDIESASFAVKTADQMLREGNLRSAVALADYARSVAMRPFLSDADGWWVAHVRFRLREVLLWALGVLGEGHLKSGRPHLAAQVAEQATVLEPFRERTHRLLMRAHAAAGNPAEALRVYDRCRRLLAEELGVQPAPETAALHRKLIHSKP